jgi:hypothetical protein
MWLFVSLCHIGWFDQVISIIADAQPSLSSTNDGSLENKLNLLVNEVVVKETSLAILEL